MKKILLFLCFSMISNFAFTQWIQQNSNTNKMLRSICFMDENRGIVVGDSGTILKTTDGGTVWTNISSGTLNNLNSVDFANADSGFIVGDNGIVIRTFDSGSTWTPVYCPLNDDLYCVTFADYRTCWITAYIDIMMTKDWGSSMYILAAIMPVPLYSAFFTDTVSGQLVGSGVDEIGVINSFPGGLKILPEGRTGLYSVFCPDDTTAYAAGLYGTIIKSTDVGATWNILQHDMGPNYYSVFFTDKNTGYVAGADGMIKKTTNGGLSWTVSSSGTTEVLRNIYFLNTDTGYTVGGNGTILKTNSGGFVHIENKEPTEPAFTVYPIPANEKIMVSTGKSSPERFILTITDLTGIQKMYKEMQNQTYYELDVSTFLEGIYLMKIETQKGVEYKKVVIK